MEVPAEQRVIDRFIKDGRLEVMPTKQAKRRIVLNHIAQAFEPGQRYSELQVNTLLRGFYDDVAALRRCLVDEAFLTRESNIYWRSGGSVSTGAGSP